MPCAEQHWRTCAVAYLITAADALLTQGWNPLSKQQTCAVYSSACTQVVCWAHGGLQRLGKEIHVQLHNS
jgi:hypothetical protein